MTVQQILSSDFEYNLWDADFGGLRFGDLNDIIPDRCVGWCHGSLLECRPKPESIAVMFKYVGSDDKFWFHIEYEDIDIYGIKEDLFDGFKREEQV